MVYDTAIIGGGAGGLIAAASGLSNSIILEKNQRVGKKILATGNGRCNISNINASESFYYAKERKALFQILNHFSAGEVLDFFKEKGLLLRYEEDGRVYPYSNQAASVLDCLRNEVSRHNTEVKIEFEAVDISKKNGIFTIFSKSGERVQAENVIIATGGPAGDGGNYNSGYTLLKKLGHEISEFSPALVPLKIKESFCKSMSGIRFKGAAGILKDNRLLKEENGEILFTDYGVSGIAVMQLSSLYDKKGKFTLKLDFFPEFSYEDIYNILYNRKRAYGKETLEEFLTGTINKKLAHGILKASGIEKLSVKAENLTGDEIKEIAGNLKSFSLTVTDTAGFKNAQVTKGGARLSEFNPETMESKRIKGVYAVGEALDVNGLCGGFNLHFAWVTGLIAAKAIKGENHA